MLTHFSRIVVSARKLANFSFPRTIIKTSRKKIEVSSRIFNSEIKNAGRQTSTTAGRAENQSNVNYKNKQTADITKISTNKSGNGVSVEFSDGNQEDFFHIWLRDSCQCSFCFNETVQLRYTGSWLADLNIQPLSLEINEDGHMKVLWPPNVGEVDNHISIFKSSWLWECSQKMKEGLATVPSASEERPGRYLWSKLHELPTVHFEAFIGTDEGLRHWMEHFHRFGFVILKGVPHDSTAAVAKRISFMRETCFGVISELLLGPESENHPSYTGDPIQLHTDLTYMERSPGTINLHCVRSADPETAGPHAGGQSVLADGIQVAEWLRQHQPEFFKVLTEIRIPYKFRMPSTGFIYTAHWPVITLSPRGDVQEIHYSHFARQVLNIQPDLILNVYDALKAFSNRLEDSKVSFYLQSGDLLSANNRRVLHARTAFDPSKAVRHLRTFYMDLNEVYGRYDISMETSDY